MAYIKLKDPTAFIIQKQVIRVEKLVGQKNKFKDVAFKQKTKLLERNRREEVEEKYEDRKDDREKLVSNKFTTPRLGFLDSVKNFLFSLLFGALTLKLLPHLPKLKGLLITTLKIGNFGIEFAGTILNAMATFVNEAYKLVDFGKQQAKLLGGDTGVANYEKMLSLANKVINSMLIAGMIFSDLVESDASSSAGQQAVDLIKDRVVQQAGQRAAQQAAIRGATQIGARAAAGVIAGVGLISSALGEGAFQLRKFTTKIETDAYKGLEDAKKDPNPFTRFVKTAFYNAVAIPGMRFYNFMLNGVGTLLDIVGAPFRYAVELLNYGVMFLTGDSAGIKEQRENLGKFDARIREQLREIVNTLSFGMIAKQKGSFGSLFGDEAVRAMGYASGGAITRSGEIVGGVIGRSEGKRAVARTIEIPLSPLLPGVDVDGYSSYFSPFSNKPNGKSKIETFFPNPESPSYINSYGYLNDSYTIASSGTFLKPFLQMPIKLIMGNGPSEGDYNSLASVMSNLFNYMMSNTMVPGKKMSLADEIGMVDISRWFRNNIKESMIDPVNSLLKSLKKQFKLGTGYVGGNKSKPKEGKTAEENPLTEFGGEAQFVIGDSIARGFAGLGATPGTDADDSKNGRSPSAVLEVLKRKGDMLKGMLIDLSTGIANNVTDFASVDAQLSYLKSIGARVRILGVGNTFSKENGGINEKLQQLASKYGFYFYGGYKGGADKVHATPEDYSELKAKRERETSTPSDQQVPVGQDNTVGDKSGKKIYLHWTASDYNLDRSIWTDNYWAGYHRYILGNGQVVPNRHPGHGVFGATPPNHTWGRNTSSSASFSVSGMAGASPSNFGSYPIKANQYESMASSVASLAKSWGWKKDDITSRNVITHSEAAKMDGYAGERWDLDKLYQGDSSGSGPNKIRGMIKGKMRLGGYIKSTGKYLTHIGEYVIDADSVRSFGMEFYDIINQVETASQRKNAAESLIYILSQYTEEGYLEDNTYYISSPTQIVMAPPQVIPIGSSGGGFVGGGDDDPSLDYTVLR